MAKRISQFAAIDDVSAVSAQTSAVTNVETLDSASYHVKFSAPNSGTFTVQARNAHKTADPTANWFEVNFGAPLTITAETDVEILLNEMPFAEIKLIWTPSAGSGTMSAFLVAKAKGV